MLLAALNVYLFAAFLLSVIFGSYALAKGRSVRIRLFAALTFCIAVYVYGYILELNSTTLENMKLWNQFQYLTLPFYPSFWILLSLAHAKTVRFARFSAAMFFFVVPSITFFLRLTNDFHGLYYSSMTVGVNAFFPVLLLGKGQWYYVNAAYLVLCFLFAFYYYFTRRAQLSDERRKSFLILTAGAILPLIGLGLILVDFGKLGLDYAAMLLPLSLIFIRSALFHYDFLEIKSLARDIIFDTSTNPMILADEADILTDHNRRARELFPELSSSATGMPLSRLLASRADLLPLLSAAPDSPIADLVYRADSGRYYRIAVSSIRNGFGNVVGRLIGFFDCTEDRLARELLLERASIDSLTGLCNRSAFMVRAEAAFADARADGVPFSIIMIDLDHFKAVNDTFGHAAGDEVLRRMGAELAGHFRSTDAAARVGGEEFAVILPGASLEDAFSAAEKFRLLIADSPAKYEGWSIPFSFSAGVAEYSPTNAALSDLMKAADAALYESKRGGRNRTTRVQSV